MKKSKVLILVSLLILGLGGLSACALGVTKFTPSRKYSEAAVPEGQASMQPLRSGAAFAKAMKPYPVIKNSGDTGIVTPGIYGAYGLEESSQQVSEVAAYDLVKSKHYTPQGMTISDQQIFVSAYDHAHKTGSVIFVLDLDGNYVKTIGLDNKAHVGGIGYDTDRHVLWVADSIDGKAVLSGIIQSAIDTYDIKSKQPINYGITIFLDGIKAVSTLSFSGDIIWMGYFTQTKGAGQIQMFVTKSGTVGDDGDYNIELENEGNFYQEGGAYHMKADVSLKAPDKIQGLAIGGQYLYLTQSYGNNSSKLLRYEFKQTSKGLDITNGRSVKMPPYLEQASLDAGGNIYPLFESSSASYRKKTNAFVDRLVQISPANFMKYSKKDHSIKTIKLRPVESESSTAQNTSSKASSSSSAK